jgi:hypothetical protein
MIALIGPFVTATGRMFLAQVLHRLDPFASLERPQIGRAPRSGDRAGFPSCNLSMAARSASALRPDALGRQIGVAATMLKLI